ncbi:MAG: O-antigen ligase family protein [Candidatus Sumerlaeaceae bacterium]|nr:O-antigen ligase family protein [Candidatus Sumerlaeaceae bacterium]
MRLQQQPPANVDVLTPPPSGKPLSGNLTVAAIAAAGGVLALALMVAGGNLLSAANSELSVFLPVVALFGVAALALAVTRPRWVFLCFLLGAICIPETLETTYLPLGFMKLYIQDLVFLFNCAIIAVRLSVGKGSLRGIPFNRYVLIYFLFGLWGVVNGLLLSGNPYDEVLGDFRRAYFYFMNYFVVILLVDDIGETRLLRNVIFAGTLLLMAKGILQVALGQFYVRRAGDAAHILSHNELTTVTFGIFLALSHILFDPAARRWLWAAVVTVGLGVVAIGNYRSAWLGLIGGLFFIFLFLPARKKTVMIGATLLATAFLALAIFAMWDYEVVDNSTLGRELLMKTDVKAAALDLNVIWRWQSYDAAVQRWLESPIFGAGLGTYLTFYTVTSTGGSMLADSHNIHNSLLWILMVQGVVGFAFIVFLHFTYLRTVVRYLRTSNWLEGKTTLFACGAFYVSMMIATMFQNFLENAMPVTIFAAVTALTMLTIFDTKRAQSSSAQSPTGIPWD